MNIRIQESKFESPRVCPGWRQYKKDKSLRKKERYKSTCSEIKNKMKTKQREYLNDFVEHMTDQPKRFSSLLKSKCGMKRIPEVMCYGNVDYSSAVDKANVFNTLFESSFTLNIPDHGHKVTIPVYNTDTVLENAILGIVDIRLVLCQLKTDKAIGIDKTPSQILRFCCDLLAPSIFP